MAYIEYVDRPGELRPAAPPSLLSKGFTIEQLQAARDKRRNPVHKPSPLLAGTPVAAPTAQSTTIASTLPDELKAMGGPHMKRRQADRLPRIYIRPKRVWLSQIEQSLENTLGKDKLAAMKKKAA
eukprot:TRINITY_DN12140_c0_g1_i5.p1 TRINITY_DN12140_c0_g1~~TRINITY_DN12140_c0_g1_i5.p1  ORF type:complete len:125 (+),score=57.06 TRINITY_DN12140_c0_g1_i5:119-493(+)